MTNIYMSLVPAKPHKKFKKKCLTIIMLNLTVLHLLVGHGKFHLVATRGPRGAIRKHALSRVLDVEGAHGLELNS